MGSQRAARTHTLLVTAIAIVTAITAYAAQDPPGTPQPDMPTAAMWNAAIARVRTMPASSLDPALPPITVDDWLFATLGGLTEIPRERLADWRWSGCDDWERSRPGFGRVMCVEAVVPIDAQKAVHVEFATGVWTDEPGRRPGWRLIAPSLRDVYIDRLDGLTRVDSLDAPVTDLAAALKVPFDRWPESDLYTEITWTPRTPAPGQTVTFTIEAGNKGRRNVERASLRLMIAPCCENGREVHAEWFPHFAAGQSARFTMDVVLSEGLATALASISPFHSVKVVRESNQTNNRTEVAIGNYPKPPRR
jgi:hypothetical protein